LIASIALFSTSDYSFFSSIATATSSAFFDCFFGYFLSSFFAGPLPPFLAVPFSSDSSSPENNFNDNSMSFSKRGNASASSTSPKLSGF